MKRFPLVLGCALSALGLFAEREAEACGGCFVQQSENTQVTGHRMALSVSKGQTTLYDQITYSGNPADFAWVLPIRGKVDVGVSSDALFTLLEQMTAVTVTSPFIQCDPGGQGCDFASAGDGGTGGASAGEDDVVVLAEEVVGPYETVQLSSTDPVALAAWLEARGYQLPPEVSPVVEDYVNEGFDFLAVRLVPGEGIQSMKPIRVTSPGAGPGLPLRMVAAGTGAITPISLWVVSESAFVPQNFPHAEIDPNNLVWDWDAQKSNYSEVRSSVYAADEGRTWLVDAGEPIYSWSFDALVESANYYPRESGYGNDIQGTDAGVNAEADVATLLHGLNEDSLWISHFSAELPRAALADDLVVMASPANTYVNRYFEVQNSIGTPPECPAPAPPCEDGWDDGTGTGGGGVGVQGGCSVASDGDSSFAALILGGLAATGLARRRRRSV